MTTFKNLFVVSRLNNRTIFSSLFAIIICASFLFSCSGFKPPHVAKLELKEKDDAYFQFIRADLMGLQGETRRSTNGLLKLVERYPKMAYFYYLLAQNYVQEKRLQDAMDSVKKALEIEPAFVDARLFLGQIYATEGHHIEAIREFNQAIHDDPKREEGYSLLASEEIAIHEFGRAQDSLRRLISLNPDATSAYYFLGVINEQYLHRPDVAIRMYQEAISIDPANINVHNAIAELYLKRKQLNKALAKYKEMALIDPDNVAIWLRVALIHYELKEFDESIGVFERILVKNPEADKIRFYLGILYENSKQTTKAIEELAQVPANSSYFKDSRIHIAAMQRQVGNFDAAVATLIDAIEHKAQVPDFYEYLAALYEENKNYQDAIDILERGRSALPDEEKMAFLLGILYEKVEERDAAIATMREVLRINPQNASALNYIGYTYVERGERVTEALEMIEQALLLRPDDGYITDSLGWAYHRQGDDERAMKYLQKAIRLVPGEPTILDHLGEVLFSRGDTKGALKYFEQALESGLKKPEPDEEELTKIREKIERLSSGK